MQTITNKRSFVFLLNPTLHGKSVKQHSCLIVLFRWVRGVWYRNCVIICIRVFKYFSKVNYEIAWPNSCDIVIFTLVNVISHLTVPFVNIASFGSTLVVHLWVNSMTMWYLLGNYNWSVPQFWGWRLIFDLAFLSYFQNFYFLNWPKMVLV